MRRWFLTRLSIALPLAGALLCAGSCAREAPPGEVMLLISTDLSIPTDADTLRVVVTRSGESAQSFDGGGASNGGSGGASNGGSGGVDYPLGSSPGGAGPVQLPGTIALVSSGKAHDVVKVHLELLQGGADNGIVRVQRDAELQIPTEGVKELAMPLDFLCAEGRPPTPCPSGKTCDAGLCVDDGIADASILHDYVAATPATCFNVLDCFAGSDTGNITVPHYDDLGRCIFPNLQVGSAGDINVALVVNAPKVGNYGVCDPNSERCFVPLDYGPGGWQTLTDSNNQPIVGLTDAVCRHLGTSIAGVASVRTSTRCPPKSPSAGLCPENAVCITPSGINCPEDWSGFSCSGGICPLDWSGVYCTGPAQPPTATGPSHYCGEVGADPTGPIVPGLWCCGQSGPPDASEPLLIDDMSSGNFIKLKPQDGDFAGYWYSSSDDPQDISPAVTPALFTFRSIDPAAMPSDGLTISHAACLRSEQGVAGNYALEGFVFGTLPDHSSPAPFNLNSYTGISFWAYAAPGKIVDDAGVPDEPTEIRVAFPDSDTYTEITTSACVTSGAKSGGNCDAFGKVLTLTANWQLYQVGWDELSQSPDYGQMHFPALDKAKVYATNFMFLGGSGDTRSLPFDFCVAQVEFTTN